MNNSKQIAGLVGPSLIAISTSEVLNMSIWRENIAPGVHLNGALLFVSGLSIVRTHNLWVRGWPVVVTLVGWGLMLVGLFRMFAPKRYLQGVRSSAAAVIASTMVVLVVGSFLTLKAYWPRR